jgi:hypothetical protein
MLGMKGRHTRPPDSSFLWEGSISHFVIVGGFPLQALVQQAHGASFESKMTPEVTRGI